MKKAGILGLISLFGLVGCTTKTKTICVTQKQEPQIVYVDRPVEVEKTIYVDKPVEVEKTIYVDRPVEVEKTVYVDRPVEVEVEKVVYVEKSYATIENMKVEKIGDNLYKKEFNFINEGYGKIKEDKEFLELFTAMPRGYMFGGDDWYAYGTITTKAGFIIQDISFVNLEHLISKPTLYDNEYNTYKTNEEIDRPQIGGSHKFSYSNLNKEQISINVPKETELWDGIANGYRKLVITFSLRSE